MSDPVIEESRSLFVRRWGEMGATWGISRTMAEVHALLFITGQPLCTDDIMQRLEISRGSTSMNLRQLVNWGLIRRIHQRGDRKEYFVSDLNAWEMFETIARERRRREVEPIIATIERCREGIAARQSTLKGADVDEAKACIERLDGLLKFINAINAVFNMVLEGGGGRVLELAGALLPAAGAGRSSAKRSAAKR